MMKRRGRMTSFAVADDARVDFMLLDCLYLESKIESYFNPDFIVKFDEKTFSCCFLKSQVVLLEISDEIIRHVYVQNYREIVTDDFLVTLLEQEGLPIRIKRYENIGIERLRTQVVDELYLGAITSENNKALWSKYKIKFSISKNLSFKF